MSNQLPDLDENVSFVVDSGAPVGPMPMREIIDSIRAGERGPDVLVWWAGASDWLSFSSDDQLTDLLSGLPATNQPPPPDDVGELESLIDELESQAPDESGGEDDGDLEVSTDVGEFDDVEGGEKFPEPEVTSFGVDDVSEGALATVAIPYMRDEDVAEEGSADDDSADEDDVAVDVEPDEADSADVEEPAELDDADDASADVEVVEDAGEFVDDAAVAEDEAADDAPLFDPEAEAEADVLLAGGPRAMHPSAGWGVESDPAAFEEPLADVVDDEPIELAAEAEPVEEAEGDVGDEGEDASEEAHNVEMLEVEAADEHEVDDREEHDSVDEHDHVDEHDNAEEDGVHEDGASEEIDELSAQDDDELDEGEGDERPGLTGLFGSPVRDEPPVPEPTAVDAVDEDEVTSQVALETVGARIDALTSATRRSRQLDEVDEFEDVEAVEEVEAVEAFDDVEPARVPDFEPAAGSWQAVEDGEDLDERFAEMVRRSVAHQRRIDWALRVDELLLSACITAIVDKGFVLLDLESHETHQRAVFDHHDDSRHIRLELEPLSPLNAAGDPVGRHVKATVAWGREVADADAAFATVRAQVSDDVLPPGSVWSEVNMVASSATTVVNLIWAANDFVHEDHTVDREDLEASVAAILRALETRWHELFTAPE